MGMFDKIYCRYPLPDKEVQHSCFQTKDFECFLDNYIITEKGELLIEENEKFVKLDFHGDINFYTSTGSHDTGDFKWYEYKARFTEGKLQWIKRVKKDKSNN